MGMLRQIVLIALLSVSMVAAQNALLLNYLHGKGGLSPDIPGEGNFTVTFDYNPLSASLCEACGVMETFGFVTFVWSDSRLSWDPEDFDGIESIRLAPKKIWIPDVVSYGAMSEDFVDNERTPVVINNDGKAMWIPRLVLKTPCRVQLTTDGAAKKKQSCMLYFGSWTHDKDFVDIHHIQSESSDDHKKYKLKLGDYETFGGYGHWKIDAVSIRNYYLEEYPIYHFVDLEFDISKRGKTGAKTEL